MKIKSPFVNIAHSTISVQSDSPCLRLGYFNMEKEIWKEIPGFENLYEVSSLGMVRSLDKIGYIKNQWGGITKRKQLGKKIKMSLGGKISQYLQVNLWKDNIGKTVKIHKLVAIVFLPNPENKPCVNHINGITTDNRLENLEWCTHSENSIHAVNTGLHRIKGEDNFMSKLKEVDILEIRKLKSMGIKQIEISKIFRVSKQHISDIVNNNVWRNI
jgi:hypothetical protein